MSCMPCLGFTLCILTHSHQEVFVFAVSLYIIEAILVISFVITFTTNPPLVAYEALDPPPLFRCYKYYIGQNISLENLCSET